VVGISGDTLMRALTIDFVYGELFSLPENKAVPWAELLQRSKEFSTLMQAVAFGEPESVTRTGKKFTARGKAPASMIRFGITVKSAAVVTYSVEKIGAKLRISDIKGVRVKVPLPLVPELEMSWVDVTIDKQGNFLLTTRKFLMTVTVKITPNGDVSFQ
jgi:hypothetical protein